MDTKFPPELQKYLDGLPTGKVSYFEEIGSTNDEALRMGRSGAPDFSLVIADRQSAGRGRLGRNWITRAGAALAFSLVIHPTPEEMSFVSYFSPWGGLAVCLALEDLGLQPQIKWPNDVLLERRKVAGVLLESTWMGAQIRNLVIGVGINVTPDAVPPAGTLQYPAGSVEERLGRPVNRWMLLIKILAEMIAWRPHLGNPEFRLAWEQRLAFRNEWVYVGTGHEPSRLGKVAGIELDGSLRLLDAEGQPFTVHAGELSLRPAEG